MVNAKTLKGFRDFLPQEVKKREYVLNTLKKVFNLYGFEPLETPDLEYEEILTGKYGQEGDKLMYRFEDNGKRKVALRYDQTVPLARVVAQYQNEIPLPFKRYQIQNVWRAENTQKGRYREFLQVDADIVGIYSPLADAEIIAITYRALIELGFNKFKILINDRKSLNGYFKTSFNIPDEKIATITRIIDKLKKIGIEKATEELIIQGFSEKEAKEIFENFKTSEMSAELKTLFNTLTNNFKLDKDKLEFTSYLARGLDYYTGLIFEVEIEGYETGSVAGGGRYDNLIGIFANKDIPAVGFSFGFDRLIEAMDELNLFPENLNKKRVFVAFSNSDLQEKALEIATKLRNENIASEIYLEDASLEKQLKYADKKQIPYSIIVSAKEMILKDMQKRTQEALPLDEIIKRLK